MIERRRATAAAALAGAVATSSACGSDGGSATTQSFDGSPGAPAVATATPEAATPTPGSIRAATPARMLFRGLTEELYSSPLMARGTS